MKLVLSISWIILNVLCKLLDCTKCTTGVVLSVVHTSNIMTNTWIHPSSHPTETRLCSGTDDLHGFSH